MRNDGGGLSYLNLLSNIKTLLLDLSGGLGVRMWDGPRLGKNVAAEIHPPLAPD